MDWRLMAVVGAGVVGYAIWLTRGEMRAAKRRREKGVPVELSLTSFRWMALATVIANLVGLAGWIYARFLLPDWWASAGLLSLLPALFMFRIAELTCPADLRVVLAGERHPAAVSILALSGLVWAGLWGWELSHSPSWVYLP